MMSSTGLLSWENHRGPDLSFSCYGNSLISSAKARREPLRNKRNYKNFCEKNKTIH